MAKLKRITKITVSDFEAKARRSRTVNLFIWGIIFAIGGFATAIWTFNDTLWFGIVAGLFGVVVLAMSIIILKSGLKEAKEDLPWITALEKRYGGLEKTLNYIQQHIAEGKPSTTITEGTILATVTNNPTKETSFMIVSDWWLANIHDLDELEIINIHDIVSIVGDLDMGTMILVNDQINAPRIVPAMFGRNRWGEVFNLFTAINSNILDQDTEITMPDASISSIYELVTKGETVLFGKFINSESGERKNWYELIVNEYNKQM